EWPRRPFGTELVPQFIFVGEAIEDGRGRALHSRQHGQKGAAAAVAVLAPPPAEDAIPILPHDLEAVFSLSAKRKRLLQLPCSAGQAARSRSTHSAQTFAVTILLRIVAQGKLTDHVLGWRLEAP